MTEIMARFLKRRGHDVTVAHYATLTDDPDLVVPSWQSVTGKIPRTRTTTCFGDFPCVSVGCRFPELEFPYYLTTSRWKNSHSRARPAYRRWRHGSCGESAGHDGRAPYDVVRQHDARR